MMMGFERVGIALVKRNRVDRWPLEPTGRVDEYGIWRSPSGFEYVKYEGYRENGYRVGLPLAGLNAAHMQTLIPLDPRTKSFEKTYFS